MQYFLLIIGIALIIVAILKSNRKENKPVKFNNVLDTKMDNNNADNNISLSERIMELERRVENIEQSLLLIDDRITVNESTKLLNQKVLSDYSSKQKISDKKAVKKIKESESKDDNIINTDNNPDKNIKHVIQNESGTSENEKQNDINDMIYKMTDIGKTVDEISSELRLGKGEVLLRLGLRKQKE